MMVPSFLLRFVFMYLYVCVYGKIISFFLFTPSLLRPMMRFSAWDTRVGLPK